MHITATIIADSICDGSRLSTLELEYPRFIHSEFMTHRLLSRNAASSRAIPSKDLRKQVWRKPAMPVHFGQNQKGMQACKEVTPLRQALAIHIWKTGGKLAVMTSYLLSRCGLHKQLSNRVLEPWQMMKVVVSSTEWANFLWLRNHSDAQPEIALLAKELKFALGLSTPTELRKGEWHLPYVSESLRNKISLEDAKAISASCCAQVSYRTLDGSLDKAKRIANMLTSGSRIHASPFEHQATPIANTGLEQAKDAGVTHCDTNGFLWSANFKGWIQHRQLIKGHTKW